jgi:HSP20 family molecular chaperone IbpA
LAQNLLPAISQSCSDEIATDYRGGVLTVHLPKKQQVNPKRITVEAE